MKAEVLNAFFAGAANSLARETNAPVRRIGLHMDVSDQVSDEVTVYVAMVGRVRGMVLVGMPSATARSVAGQMVGEEQKELTEMGLSALAELGNLIAAGAAVELEKTGISPCDITPPTIMIGRRSRISTLGLPRFIIPLATVHGDLNVHVAVDILPA
ncbi:MAG TPA: chemotaxis protein CheX [Symbiobacteriaceae bacterium]|jgi:chemotaxis protein CheX|nr:chemotaxis protein CheX [Symbiobacteriaceae bacterium]